MNMSDEVAIALIGLLSSMLTGVSAALTVLARRVHQNTVAVTAVSERMTALLVAITGKPGVQ